MPRRFCGQKALHFTVKSPMLPPKPAGKVANSRSGRTRTVLTTASPMSEDVPSSIWRRMWRESMMLTLKLAFDANVCNLTTSCKCTIWGTIGVTNHHSSANRQWSR